MAKRRFPVAWAVGGVGLFALAGGIGWMLWEENRPRLEAPTEALVCWRMTNEDGRVVFTPRSRGVENLESCAATLEALHLQTGAPVSGAYQGRFIFVSREAVQSAETYDGARWRIFYGPQREALDNRIRRSQGLGVAGPTVIAE